MLSGLCCDQMMGKPRQPYLDQLVVTSATTQPHKQPHRSWDKHRKPTQQDKVPICTTLSPEICCGSNQMRKKKTRIFDQWNLSPRIDVQPNWIQSKVCTQSRAGESRWAAISCTVCFNTVHYPGNSSICNSDGLIKPSVIFVQLL